MTRLSDPLTFTRGPAMANRVMLAPLTNMQSHDDGTLSDDEFHWLTMRGQGGFGLTMTCAAHVQRRGRGFPGQLGVFSDDHLPGLTRLAAAIRAGGGVSSLQMHHAGIRSPKEVIGETPVGPSADEETGARALSLGEVEQLTEDFIAAAVRTEKAGFDGAEIHGAHGYILTQFLSAETNRREDRYGGSLENRTRIVRDIIAGVRERCRPDFQLGLRLSTERFGLQLAEMRQFAGEMLTSGNLDYVELSLWDLFKEPVEDAFKGRKLAAYFTELDRGATRLGAAGKILTAANAQAILDDGFDFVLVGRGAILHHDWARRALADPGFQPHALPVSRAHLHHEGLSETFINYMNTWPGFVAQEEPAAVV